jgi:hypothetical protein
MNILTPEEAECQQARLDLESAAAAIRHAELAMSQASAQLRAARLAHEDATRRVGLAAVRSLNALYSKKA